MRGMRRKRGELEESVNEDERIDVGREGERIERLNNEIRIERIGENESIEVDRDEGNELRKKEIKIRS